MMDEKVDDCMNAMQAEIKNPIEPSLFKQAAGRWATGCAIVTTLDAGGRPQGLTMSAVTSLSLDPMQFLICLDRRTRTLGAVRTSRVFAINMLADGQSRLAMKFARKADDKFEDVTYSFAHGVPVLADTLGYVVCDVTRILDGGDHEIVIGDVRNIQIGIGDPLLHFRGSFGRFAPAAA